MSKQAKHKQPPQSTIALNKKASHDYFIEERIEAGIALEGWEVKSLRDVTDSLLEENREHLDPVIYNRCRFVVDENQRVLDACCNLESGDLVSFGRCMVLSHEGLRDLYEVSCEELNFLVEEAGKLEGVLGSRMMGGGFGGCTVNLVSVDQIDKVSEVLGKKYQAEFGFKPDIYTTKIGSGTQVVLLKSEVEFESSE